MSYELDFTKAALRDLKRHKKSGDKAINQKLGQLLQELIDHPRTGVGQPKQLKHNYAGMYSRRISMKHRLVYQIKDELVIVVVIGALGHYDDR